MERFLGPGVPELWVGDLMDGPLFSPEGTEFEKMKDVLKMDGSDGSQQWGHTKAIELYTVKWLKMVNFMLFKIYCWNISGNLYIFLWKLEKFCSGYPQSFSLFWEESRLLFVETQQGSGSGQGCGHAPIPLSAGPSLRLPPLTAGAELKQLFVWTPPFLLSPGLGHELLKHSLGLLSNLLKPS